LPKQDPQYSTLHLQTSGLISISLRRERHQLREFLCRLKTIRNNKEEAAFNVNSYNLHAL